MIWMSGTMSPPNLNPPHTLKYSGWNMDNDTAENITIVKLNPCKFSVALTPKLKDKNANANASPKKSFEWIKYNTPARANNSIDK